MDFSQFDSRTAAETPVKMPVLAQSTGKPIFDGDKQCFVLVKGASSRSVQAEIRKAEAAQMKKTSGKKTDDEMIDVQKQLARVATPFVAGFENIQRPDETGKLRDLTASKEDCAWFFDLNMISVAHLTRVAGGDLVQDDDESDDDFDVRKNGWLKPSFIQQVIDAARADDDFLAQAEKG